MVIYVLIDSDKEVVGVYKSLILLLEDANVGNTYEEWIFYNDIDAEYLGTRKV